ncbi:MAG: hypothetical protein KC680_01970 [Candidatus Peregrinibacteria bacterium]|nr:hypothetical protein [Candidatus Peregrinibacteria bacterium]MCB9808217.1 hypothetical protein [Candidatus Peribacteria bacterium]
MKQPSKQLDDDISDESDRALKHQSNALRCWAMQTEPELLQKEMKQRIKQALQVLKDAKTKKKYRNTFKAIMKQQLPYLAEIQQTGSSSQFDCLFYTTTDEPPEEVDVEKQDSREEKEEQSALHKELAKRIRKALRTWCSENPVVLLNIPEDNIVLALSMKNMEPKERDAIVEKRSAALLYISRCREKTSANLPPETTNDIATILKFIGIQQSLHSKKETFIWPQQLRICMQENENEQYSEEDEGVPFVRAINDMLKQQHLHLETITRFRARKNDPKKRQAVLVQKYRLDQI